MYVRSLALLVAALLLSSCATPIQLSGPVLPPGNLNSNAVLNIGLVADSQLQTRANANLVSGYRDRTADYFVGTAIRPPALDWAARSMLRGRLAQLKQSGAKVVFYLGDGANNGCYDEFAQGYQDGTTPDPNDQGILQVLHEFREANDIPVFFILGNHDLLGAGSTSDEEKSKRLCEGKGKQDRHLQKFEIMELAERFNRANGKFNNWLYRSSFDQTDGGAALRAACLAPGRPQHRNRGCYLAATVDYRAGPVPVQFLLLDTNDWADVSRSEYFGMEQYGARGAMTFADSAGSTSLSQTGWFNRKTENTAEKGGIRIALSHYNVRGLRKFVPFTKIGSSKSQRFSQLFTDEAKKRGKIQDHAYVITGHTHFGGITPSNFTFKEGCWFVFCSRENRFKITELNVGSTTDFPSYAALAKVDLNPDGDGAIAFQHVDADRRKCAPVYSAIADYTFPKKIDGHDRGFKAIGIDSNNPASYISYDFEDLKDLWDNLEDFVKQDPLRSECIGLYAAAVEKKIVNPHDPVLRR